MTMLKYTSLFIISLFILTFTFTAVKYPERLVYGPNVNMTATVLGINDSSDNQTGPGEVCDGTDVNGYTCATVGAGFKSGTLSCNADRKSYNTSACVAGNTITALSCSQSDVQSAVNSASDGDIVVVPAGSCAWEAMVTINKPLLVKGQTTTLRNDSTFEVVPTDRTIISKNGFFLSGTNNIRITGFTFVGNVSGSNQYAIWLPAFLLNVRIDHNHFLHYAKTWNKGGGGGYLNVLFDYNRITQPGEENLYIVGAGNQSWIDAGNCGDENPERVTWLENNEWLLETASVTNPIDSGEGARVALRNNRFSGTANYSFELISETHGHFWGQRDGYDNAGAYCFELSNNKILKPAAIGNNGEVVLKTRAGRNYVYNNSLSTALPNAWGQYIRYWPQEADLGYSTSGGCSIQEHEDMGLHDIPWGSPQWDGHCIVYPCPMQPNNSYNWGNTWDNGTPTVGVQGTGVSNFMQEDRDYWDDIGTGDTNFVSGLFSSRPTSSVLNNVYWATDQSKLYRSFSENNWTEVYSAYVYPHPLSLIDSTEVITPPPTPTPTPPPTPFTLTTSASNGTITTSPDQADYTSGTIVTLTANPSLNYVFDHWSGDISSTTNPLTITLTANTNITAHFTYVEPLATPLLLTLTANNGTITKNPNLSTYSYGTTVTLTATPNTNYTFTNWTGSVSTTSNPLLITMDGDKNVTANFTVRRSGGGGGGGGSSYTPPPVTPVIPRATSTVSTSTPLRQNSTGQASTTATSSTSSTGMSICQFVNLLIAIDVVPVSKALVVKVIFGCR